MIQDMREGKIDRIWAFNHEMLFPELWEHPSYAEQEQLFCEAINESGTRVRYERPFESELRRLLRQYRQSRQDATTLLSDEERTLARIQPIVYREPFTEAEYESVILVLQDAAKGHPIRGWVQTVDEWLTDNCKGYLKGTVCSFWKKDSNPELPEVRRMSTVETTEVFKTCPPMLRIARTIASREWFSRSECWENSMGLCLCQPSDRPYYKVIWDIRYWSPVYGYFRLPPANESDDSYEVQHPLREGGWREKGFTMYQVMSLLDARFQSHDSA